jgi:hypothetical protein
MFDMPGGWTAYLNNDLGGGDPTASASHIARLLGARHVVAMHKPGDGEPHAATQFWLCGPQGMPPLHYIRTLAAYKQDGRWRWLTSGTQQAFEQPEHYQRRRIRDRLSRELLVAYLAALGLHVDNPANFKGGVLVREG